MSTHEGKAAIVTGGSRGIGRAIAHELVSSGARVLITGRKQPALESAAADLGPACSWTVCHAADETAAKQCVEQACRLFGTVDLLVNNAAVNPQWGPAIEVDAAMAAKMAEVNVWAPLLWTRLAWRYSMAANGGSVVNISSIGATAPAPGTGYYNVTKAALNLLTRQLAEELAPTVRVNAVAPGLIATDMAANIPDESRASLLAGIPLGRLGTPDDIAAAASFLLSDQAGWITGAIVTADGGAQDSWGR